jgi:hypothetical protein
MTLIRKKRYLFPAVYAAVLGASFLFSPLFYVLFVLSMPMIIVMHSLSLMLSGPRDTTYFVFVGAILQYFVLGLLFDKIVERLTERRERFR